MPTVKKVGRPAWMPERKPHERRVHPNSELYNSKRWRGLALKHKRANPLCAHCMKEGRVTAAEVTDHIQPVNQGGQPYDWNNLQSLCNACHAVKSGQEAHEGRGGKKT